LSSCRGGNLRIFRLYLALASAGLRSQLQYRTNCITLITMGLIWQGTGFVFIWIILSQFQNLQGWVLGEIAFLYGLRLIVHACSMLFFGLFQRVEFLIRGGWFDKFLSSPVPPLLSLMTYQFHVAACGDLLGGILIFAAATTRVQIHWSPFAATYLVLAVIGGCLVETAVKLAVSSLSFRTLSSFSLVSFFDDTMSLAGNYPLTIYGGVVRFLFIFVLPVAFLAYFPAVILLHHVGELSVSPSFAFLSPIIGTILFILACLLFQSEIKHYQSSGH